MVADRADQGAPLQAQLEPAVATAVAYRIDDQFMDRHDEVESRVTDQPGRGQPGGQHVTQGRHGSRGERLPQQQPARRLAPVIRRRYTAIAVMPGRRCRSGNAGGLTEEPVDTAPDAVQFRQIARFDDVGIDVHGVAGSDVTGIRRARQHDDRDGTQPRIGLDLGERRPAVQAGHVEIQQDQVRVSISEVVCTDA